MATHISRSPEETLALGEAWGRIAQPGWVIGLIGDLGAGKTLLARGIARGAGFLGRVHSPTFALLNAYQGGRVPMLHLDLYRLESRTQILDAGLAESVEHPEGISIVEWFDRWDTEPWIGHAGVRLRRVRITMPSEAEREIHYEDVVA